MTVVICPGIHEHTLTQTFLAALEQELQSQQRKLCQPWQIFPADQWPAYSAPHLLAFLHTVVAPPTPITLIAFSAGVVGAIATAWSWEAQGGVVRALIALDGWGVPLYGNFPIHRLSHDAFTHWSSQLLGGDRTSSFYADPPVEHRELWRSPHQVQGWQITPLTPTAKQMQPARASQLLVQLLERYGEITNF